MQLREIINIFPKIKKKVECNSCDIKDIKNTLNELDYVEDIMSIDYNNSNQELTISYLDQDGNTQIKSTLITIGGTQDIGIRQQEDTYSDFIPGSAVGEIAYAENSQGTPWLPGTLGGTYYPAGFYVWNGIDWVSDRNAIANQLAENIFDIGGNANNIINLDQRITILENEEHIIFNTLPMLP